MIGFAGLLRNKKGADYSAFLVIVVFISVIYLFIQLYSKVSVFELSVGDQELALMNAYKGGDSLLLFTDQAARYSAYQAVSDVARNGGFVFESEPCGNVDPIVSQRILFRYPFWFKGGKKCYAGVTVHDSFEHYLAKNLGSFFEKSLYSVQSDDFEFTIADDKVIGVSLRPVLVPVLVSPEKKLFYGEVMSRVFREFGVAGLGVYSVRPSFSIDVQARISDYELLKSQVDVLLDCVKTGSLDSCVKSAGSDELKWFYQQVPGTSSFVFDVKQAKAVNPFKKDPVYIRFALDLPGVKIQ